MAGFNIFDEFDFITWASYDFMERHGLFTYEDALTQFEKLHSIEASFAICWQQLDSLFFCLEADELRAIKEEAFKEIDAAYAWRGIFLRHTIRKELWDQIEFESDEDDHSDEDSHHNEVDYEVIKEVFEEDAHKSRAGHLDRLSSLVKSINPRACRQITLAQIAIARI